MKTRNPKLICKVFIVGVIFWSFASLVYASEEKEINISSAEGQKEVVLPVSEELKPESLSAVVRKIEDAEKGTFEVAKVSSEAVLGEGTKQSVQVVQKIADPLFARFFRFLDKQLKEKARQSET